MSIDVRVSHINVHQPATDAVRRYNIDGVVGIVRATQGVGTFNEIGKAPDHRYIASLKPHGIGSYVYGENGIVWDARRFDVLLRAKYRIMVGGHVGADGKPGGDSRRVGPSRYVLIVVLRDRKTGYTAQFATTHLVAKADTSAKWRRGIRAASIALAGLRISRINRNYPNGVLNGDMNFTGPRLNFPHLAETQLPLLRTMGNQHYDRGFVWGNVRLIGKVSTFRRKSDHLGFTYTVRIGDGPTPNVPPVSHTGDGVKPGPKQRALLVRIWRHRTRRWKRRHPRLWRRIVQLRRRHPRP